MFDDSDAIKLPRIDPMARFSRRTNSKYPTPGGAPAPKQKTGADLEAAAEKVRRAAVSRITKH